MRARLRAGCRATRRLCRSHDTTMSCFVSIIVATHNRAARLAETLHTLAGQQWPRDRFEIIVADNRSSDETRQVVESAAARPDAPQLRYLYVAEPGKSYAVNAAL